MEIPHAEIRAHRAGGNAGGSQATFVSSKAEDSANDYPGFVLRRSGTSLQLTARWKGDSNNAVTFSSAAHSVKISRRKEEATPGNITYKIYYTVDGVASQAPVKGVNIVKYVYSNGAVKTVKIMK